MRKLFYFCVFYSHYGGINMALFGFGKKKEQASKAPEVAPVEKKTASSSAISNASKEICRNKGGASCWLLFLI